MNNHDPVAPGRCVATARLALCGRLEQGVALLILIDRKRQETGMLGFGANVERTIIDRELADLEKTRFPLDLLEWEGETASDMPEWTSD